MDILALVSEQLQGEELSAISRSIGADEQTTRGAIGSALPVLVTALAGNAAKPAAAAQLHDAIRKDHDGSLLDNLSGFLGNPAMGNGAGILKHILGGRQGAVEAGVAGGTGLDGGQAAKLLQILAPIVMAALGKAQSSGNLDAGGLAGMLTQQKTAAGGGLLGALTGMLDADGDGSAIDDIGKMAGGFFGKKG
jgi:hypothetical protein